MPSKDYDEEEMPQRSSKPSAAAAPAADAAASAAPASVVTAASANDKEGKEKEKEKEEELPPLQDQIKGLLMGSKVNVLLVAVPICWLTGDGTALTFVMSFLGLIPLAALLGDLTEALSDMTNDTVASLLNATMGNLTELIVSIFALKNANLALVTQSLVGSVVGNSLLVLGSAILLGGLKIKLLVFNEIAVRTYSTGIMVSIFAYAIASTLSLEQPADDSPVSREQAVLNVSRWCSLLLCCVYISYVYFTQNSHKHLFDGEEAMEKKAADELREKAEKEAEEAEKKNKEEQGEAGAAAAAAAVASGKDDTKEEKKGDDDDDDDDDDVKLGLWFSLVAMAIVTLLISFLSDFLVKSVKPAAEAIGLSQLFIGACVVPIAANCAEHGSSLIVAARGRMDLAVGIALGSAVQISMFVFPFTVVVGFFMDVPMDLVLAPFLLGMMVLSAILVYFLTASGTSTWLGGAKLLCAYAIVAIAMFNAHDPMVRQASGAPAAAPGLPTTRAPGVLV